MHVLVCRDAQFQGIAAAGRIKVGRYQDVVVHLELEVRTDPAKGRAGKTLAPDALLGRVDVAPVPGRSGLGGFARVHDDEHVKVAQALGIEWIEIVARVVKAVQYRTEHFLHCVRALQSEVVARVVFFGF